jgi:hypothetical protein
MRKFTLIAGHAALSLSLLALVACSATNSSASGGSPTPTANAATAAAENSRPAPSPSALAPAEAEAQAHGQEKHPEDEIPRATGAEAKKLSDAKQAVIVDVRSSDAYKSGHAKGALNVTLEDIEKGEHKALPRDKQLITYCT